MENNWDSITTDPKEFDDENFVYLVHGIQFGITFREELKKEEGSKEEYVDLLKNPNDIHKLKLISCSIIGKGVHDGETFNCLGTFATVGLILKVPSKNILRTGTTDIGSDFINPSEYIKQHEEEEIDDPLTLLMNTQGYNEVVVQGTTKYGAVEVVGVFMNDYGRKPDELDISYANFLHFKTGTPIVKIRSSEVTLQDDSIKTGNSVILQKFPLPKQKSSEVNLQDEPIHIEKNDDGTLRRISYTKNNQRVYCNLEVGFPYKQTWCIYATSKTEANSSPYVRDPSIIASFVKELENLPDEDKEEYQDIIDNIYSQHIMCLKYFSKEVSKDDVYAKNYIIENHNHQKKI